MGKYRKLNHVVYKCDFHIVRVPKYRLRILRGDVKQLLGKDIRMLCEWKGCSVEELNVREGHVHLLVPVTPRVSISKLIGVLKGKSAIELFKSCPRLKN